ncbi:MAG: SDR family NAD(P)-dependent oxidoreductase, partial [Pseudomonadota bacterium]
MGKAAQIFDLSGRVAVVTGASSGLGRRAATCLVDAGAKVVGVARRADALADWQISTGADGAAVVGDLSDRSTLKSLAHDVKTPFGAPDILVHAAGINTREA